MTIIQIGILAFALFAIGRTLWQFKQGALTLAWLLFWFLFWVAAGVIALMPQTADMLAQIAGVGRGVDLLIYVSILGLFFLVFRMYVKIEHVEHELTRIVRSLAIEELEDQS